LNRRSVLVALGCAALLSWMRPAWSGDDIEVIEARLDASSPEGAVTLTAEIRLALTETLRDAVVRGLPLYFLTEVQVHRPRWYWFDEALVATQIEWRLSYHALTRQYRVSSSTTSEGFAALEDAIAAMSSIRQWQVATLPMFQTGIVYDVRVRMRLDTTRLPKPFQMTALTDRNWNPQSEWKRFDFTVPTPTSAR
jgi:hypothetical protein